jgi:phosphoribosylanthranilate isomerase
VRDAASLDQITACLDLLRAAGAAPAAILVDAHVPGQYGGTGQTAPWHLLADFQPGVPLILAGGLTPDNVAEAIRIVRPYAVDVASGVESSPGKKDPDKLRRFIDAVRAS